MYKTFEENKSEVMINLFDALLKNESYCFKLEFNDGVRREVAYLKDNCFFISWYVEHDQKYITFRDEASFIDYMKKNTKFFEF